MGRSIARNLFWGAVAGVAGTALKGAFQAAEAKLAPSPESGSGDEPTTDKVAGRVLKMVGVQEPSKKMKAVGGQVVDWGYGTTWGVLTGAARSAGVRLDAGGGQALGAGLWAVGDEWMLYRLGFAKHPREYPAKVHLSALGAHAAYGLGVWSVWKLAELVERKMSSGLERELERAA